MELKPGDKVKFLNEVGGGKITKIIDKYTVLIETEDGFEIPYLKRELIKEDDEQTQSFEYPTTENHKLNISFEDQISNSEQIIEKDNEDINLYLAIVPENQKEPSEGFYNLYLINDSNWFLLYIIAFQKKEYESFPGILQPNMLELIHSFNFDELKNYRSISVQIIMYKNQPHSLHNPIFKHINIKAEKFINSNSFMTNDFFEQKARMFPIVEENPLVEAVKQLSSEQITQIINNKEKKAKKKQFRSSYVPETIEVDLHIDKLLKDTRGLNATDMLKYQMEVFQSELKKALKNPHIKKIVFIHGKGNGTLKSEIRRYLKIKNLKYQDASIHKYGFGATLVYVSPKL